MEPNLREEAQENQRKREEINTTAAKSLDIITNPIMIYHNCISLYGKKLIYM